MIVFQLGEVSEACLMLNMDQGAAQPALWSSSNVFCNACVQESFLLLAFA